MNRRFFLKKINAVFIGILSSSLINLEIPKKNKDSYQSVATFEGQYQSTATFKDGVITYSTPTRIDLVNNFKNNPTEMLKQIKKEEKGLNSLFEFSV